jgi:hypothetical protein
MNINMDRAALEEAISSRKLSNLKSLNVDGLGRRGWLAEDPSWWDYKYRTLNEVMLDCLPNLRN